MRKLQGLFMFLLGVIFTASVLSVAPVSARTAQQGERDECVTTINVDKLSPDEWYQLYGSGG